MPGLIRPTLLNPRTSTFRPSDIKGLIAEYKFTEGSGNLIDYSGNGYDGIPSGSVNYLGYAIQSGTNAYIDCPSATAAAKTTIFAYLPEVAVITSGRVLSGSGGGHYLERLPLSDAKNYPDNEGPYSTSLSLSTYINGPRLPSIICLQFADPVDRYYVEGKEPSVYYSRLSNPGGPWTSGLRFGGHNNPAACETNKYCYCLLYDRVLTYGEVRRATEYIRKQLDKRSYGGADVADPQSFDGPQWCICGNSLVANMDLTQITPTATWGAWSSRGFAIGSIPNDLVMSFALDAISPLYHPKNAHNVAIVWYGISDTWLKTKDICVQLKAQGWKVVVMSHISHLGDDTNMANANAYFGSNWTSFAHAYADLTADTDANTHLCTAGAYSDSTYYTDSVHPNATGNALIYPILTSAISTAAAA